MSGKNTAKENAFDLISKIRDGLQGKKKNSFLLFLLLLGIVLMFAGSFIHSSSKQLKQNFSQVENLNQSYNQSQNNYEKELNEKLTYILEEIDGISNVRVLITFNTGEEAVFAQVAEENTKETTERDTEGGMRDITEKTRKEEYVLIQEGGGKEKALLLMEKKPRVQGVMVVAKGAEDAGLRLKVLRAIQSLMGLPAHRIAVLPWGEADVKQK